MNTTTHIVMFCALMAGACSDGAGNTATSDKGLASKNTPPTSSSTSRGDIGDPCVLEDESKTNFSAYAETEINVESNGSPGCASGLCLSNHFRGRVSCPYGQPADPNDPTRADPSQQSCITTGTNPVPVTVPVPAQLVNRPPADSVYCSCRCDGPAGEGPFCACPSGFECAPLVEAFGTTGGAQFAGSYCIKAGTGVDDPSALAKGLVCNRAEQSCDDR